MKKIYSFMVLWVVTICCHAQPNFTYNDMPNIGDGDSLKHNPLYTHSGDLDTETGKNYTWDFSSLSFNSFLWAVDSFRQKTHAVSLPFTNADIEYFHQHTSGNNLELYNYNNDTLYIHRSGATTGGNSFSPPLASIHFPIGFNQTSQINAPIYFGTVQAGLRITKTYYDGFGKLNLPNGKSYNNVFRIKSTVKDSTFSTGFTVIYTSYLWYVQGGGLPPLRISKTDFNNSSGSIYNVYVTRNSSSSLALNNAVSNYSLYPNPSDAILHIGGSAGNQSYTVYNASGKKVDSGTIPIDQRINTEKLKKGIYFLKIDEGSSIKFIKD